ncbi:MAG: hypothetical protein NZ840_08755 [Anaerolineales bacterium]|nr:hypothetical protein [Anaerolineales bacterium]MDW8162130.1 hypothetical protein [Anaerolineales bacterium]
MAGNPTQSSRNSSLRAANPQTAEKHRRESLFQITLPFVLAVVLLGGLALSLGRVTAFNVSQGARIALIGLILPAMLLGALLLGLTTALLVGVTKAIDILPSYASLVQQVSAMLAQRTRKVADASVAPLLRLQEWAAIWQRLRRGGLHKKKPNWE